MDIFNLDDLSDIPKAIVNDLSVCHEDKFSSEIRRLFEISTNGILSIDQVTVGYYRYFKAKKNRKAFMVKLYNISRNKKGFIETVKGRKGIYKLKEQQK